MNRLALSAVVLAGTLGAGVHTAENVLVVVNENSSLSRTVGDYYALRRNVPLANVCRLRVSVNEEIARAEYDRAMAAPIANYLRDHHLTERILYMVTTSGVPLRVAGTGGEAGEIAAVDSELALLYDDMRGAKHVTRGPISNRFFGRKDAEFEHPQFPMYLVTRLTGYDFPDIKA